MSRPDFPNPYTVMTSGMISRIVSDQNYYDDHQEQCEREQQEREEQKRIDDEIEHQEYEKYIEDLQKEQHGK